MSALTFATAQMLRIMPRARLGRAAGRLAEVRWPDPVGRAVVAVYSKAYGVSLDECRRKGPWPTFDAFFTRELAHGVRPVDGDARAIVSPADGRIESMGAIDGGGTFVVKGRPYSVEELVGDAVEANRFRGGAGFVVYLSPRDYHRVHAPASGVVRRIRSMPGDYFPVNAIGLRHIPNLFCRNRRVAIEIDADGGLGRVTVVMVVAIIVGRITAIGIDARDVPLGDHTLDPPARVAKGDEIGVFHLGSTAVVLTERRPDGGRWLVAEGPVRYGEALMRAADPVRTHDAATRPAQDGHSGAGQ
ncbi:MAG TPA: archaetidylserine decarboxylase [Polyangiaceae bacterium]|nr:archaetidylserine decarboxylase [Polyangiaceae bacterium]